MIGCTKFYSIHGREHTTWHGKVLSSVLHIDMASLFSWCHLFFEAAGCCLSLATLPRIWKKGEGILAGREGQTGSGFQSIHNGR